MDGGSGSHGSGSDSGGPTVGSGGQPGVSTVSGEGGVPPAGGGQATTVQAEKRGRFNVIQISSSSADLSRAASEVSLEGMSTRGGGGGADNNGSSSSRSKDAKDGGKGQQVSVSGIPASPLLARLQELMDHAAAHQAALGRLAAAVGDADRAGKATGVLAKASSSRALSLFDGAAAAAPAAVPVAGGGGLSEVEELRGQVRDLVSRLRRLEDENATLRRRLPGDSTAGGSDLKAAGNVGAGGSSSALEGSSGGGQGGPSDMSSVRSAADVISLRGGVHGSLTVSTHNSSAVTPLASPPVTSPTGVTPNKTTPRTSDAGPTSVAAAAAAAATAAPGMQM